MFTAFWIGGALIAVGAVFLLLWFALDSWPVLFMGVALVGLGALIIWGYSALINAL